MAQIYGNGSAPKCANLSTELIFSSHEHSQNRVCPPTLIMSLKQKCCKPVAIINYMATWKVIEFDFKQLPYFGVACRNAV